MTFLNCVNYTTGASVPLMDPSSNKLTAAQIAGIVIGGIVVAFFAILFGVMGLEKCKNWRQRRRNQRLVSCFRDLSYILQPVYRGTNDTMYEQVGRRIGRHFGLSDRGSAQALQEQIRLGPATENPLRSTNGLQADRRRNRKSSGDKR